MLRDNETPSQTPYFVEIVQNTRMFKNIEHAGILNTPPISHPESHPYPGISGYAKGEKPSDSVSPLSGLPLYATLLRAG